MDLLSQIVARAQSNNVQPTRHWLMVLLTSS